PLQPSLQGWGAPESPVSRAPPLEPSPPGGFRATGWSRRLAAVVPAGGIYCGPPPFSRVLFSVRPSGARLLNRKLQLTLALAGTEPFQYLVRQLGVEHRAAGGRGVELHRLVKGRRLLQLDVAVDDRLEHLRAVSLFQAAE